MQVGTTTKKKIAPTIMKPVAMFDDIVANKCKSLKTISGFFLYSIYASHAAAAANRRLAKCRGSE